MSKPIKTQEGKPKIIIKRHQGEAQFFVEQLSDKVGIQMMLIPEGSFNMGSPEDEQDRSASEGPVHRVNVPSFFMGKYPVTQVQWKIVASLPQVNRDLKPDPAHFKGDNRPVESVSWYDALEFCQRLSQHTNRTYRLPTEAEWEYACRARTTTPFHFGETITTDLANYRGTDNKKYGWSGSYGRGPKGEYREETTAVDHFEIANAFGLCDMHGNVWEWSLDHWHDNYEDAPNDGSAWLTDDEGARRVLRGGSWDFYPRNCRCASRADSDPDLDFNAIGFRVVCELPRISNPYPPTVVPPLSLIFPLKGQRLDDVGSVSVGHMDTSFTLYNNGRLDGVTRSWTDNDNFGFTGSVAVVFVDENKHPLWISKAQEYGVDGRAAAKASRFFGGRVYSDRTEHWTDQVPSEVLTQVKGYAIIQKHEPSNRLIPFLGSEEGQRIIKAIANLWL